VALAVRVLAMAVALGVMVPLGVMVALGWWWSRWRGRSNGD
jgi:hypothetical protein